MNANLDLPKDLSLVELVEYSQVRANQVLTELKQHQDEVDAQLELDKITMLTNVMEWLPACLRPYLQFDGNVQTYNGRQYDCYAVLQAPDLAPVRFYLRKVTSFDQARNESVVTGATLAAGMSPLSVLRYRPQKWDEGWYLSYEEEYYYDLDLALSRAAEIGDIQAEVEAEVKRLQVEFEAEVEQETKPKLVWAGDYLDRAEQRVTQDGFGQTLALVGIGRAILRLIDVLENKK